MPSQREEDILWEYMDRLRWRLRRLTNRLASANQSGYRDETYPSVHIRDDVRLVIELSHRDSGSKTPAAAAPLNTGAAVEIEIAG